MSKKKSFTPIDFDFGIGEIIPATQEAYHGGEFDGPSLFVHGDFMCERN